MFYHEKKYASAGSRTRICCLEGNNDNRYTTDARYCFHVICTTYMYSAIPPFLVDETKQTIFLNLELRPDDFESELCIFYTLINLTFKAFDFIKFEFEMSSLRYLLKMKKHVEPFKQFLHFQLLEFHS